MKKFLVVFTIIFANIFASNVHAEMQTYEGKDVAMFDFGEDDAEIINAVKNVAKMRAIQAAREKAGVYLKSYSRTVNGVLTDDDISAVTNNISEILDVKYEKDYFNAVDAKGNSYGQPGILYQAIVTVRIDNAGINEYLQKDTQEKAKIIQQNKNLQASFVEAEGNFEDTRSTAKTKSVAEVKAELNKIDKEFSAAEKIGEGNKFAYQGNYSDAAEKYNEAIAINQNNYAQKNLESIYSKQELVEQEIKNLDEKIKREPKNAELYFSRGMAYISLGKIYGDLGYNNSGKKQHFNPLTLISPVSAIFSVASLISKSPEPDRKSYRLAMKDFDKAIKLNKNYASAYYQRGHCFRYLGQHKKADADFAKAKQLGYK